MTVNKPNAVVARIMPFIGFGIMIALVIIGFIIFSYLLLIGAAIGLVVFAIAYLRNKFSKTKRVDIGQIKSKGRVIDQDP